MTNDQQALIDMGFTPEKVTKALKETKNSGLQPAMDWLLEHSNDTQETNLDASLKDPSDSIQLEQGEISINESTAQSLKCDDCGKLLRNVEAAELHATKTGHDNFSESVVSIKPLTVEEKEAKLKEIQERIGLKRQERKEKEIEEDKTREKARRMTGQEIQESREKMQQLEMQKIVQERKREKELDRLAKERIKAIIEQDKKDRLAKKEKSNTNAVQPVQPVQSNQPIQSTQNYDKARIQIRLPDGTAIQESFPSDSKLQEVYNFVQTHLSQSFKLYQTFPRKALEDKVSTLKELQLVPSSALVAQLN